MAKCSKENQKKLINFQLTQAIKLQHSASALSDPEFNPNGMGRLDITEKGFEITVRNAKSKASGNLFLESSGLNHFHCSKPIVGKLINVTQIYLDATQNKDTITIYHLDGSNKLTFVLGSDPDTEYNVELFEMDAEVERIPYCIFFCEAIINSEILREMIERLEETGKSPLVSISIQEGLAAIFSGQKSWVLNYEQMKVDGTRGLEPGQEHRGWFNLEHMQAVRKASFLAPCFLVCFLSKPADNVMLRFCLRELGDFVFINKSPLVVDNSHAVHAVRGAAEEMGGRAKKIATDLANFLKI